ncbi:hypothetical protein GGS23DRAFT_616940 [Durotheca rogersii]|uniref:uncharacterized protein n=1 Tax=Durotheca rogersii TaxID=419775 RepID=UPI0022211511|nr:uncharacterized protein GGS23DRAFT_616940 [Durotheca rogersii]KAI5865829.1 hypothetical protein GGS23DRAFT_616940 [Durotheca rogersii]
MALAAMQLVLPANSLADINGACKSLEKVVEDGETENVEGVTSDRSRRRVVNLSLDRSPRCIFQLALQIVKLIYQLIGASYARGTVKIDECRFTVMNETIMLVNVPMLNSQPVQR